MNTQDEYSMTYLDSCARPVLLLIHGFPMDSLMWQIQLEDLGDMARVVAPDLRGFGGSPATLSPYSMGMFADDCASLLDYLAISRPVVVGGLSMGGYVALEFYRRYPLRVAGLILASTRAAADSPEAQLSRDKLAARVRQRGVSAVVEALLPKLFAPAMHRRHAETVEFVRQMMLAGSVEGVVGALMAMKERPSSLPTLPTIAVPTLVIHGNQDAVVPLAEAQAMAAAIPDARLKILRGVGHMSNLEEPDAFSDAVADFLDELGAEEE